MSHYYITKVIKITNLVIIIILCITSQNNTIFLHSVFVQLLQEGRESRHEY